MATDIWKRRSELLLVTAGQQPGDTACLLGSGATCARCLQPGAAVLTRQQTRPFPAAQTPHLQPINSYELILMKLPPTWMLLIVLLSVSAGLKQTTPSQTPWATSASKKWRAPIRSKWPPVKTNMNSVSSSFQLHERHTRNICATLQLAVSGRTFYPTNCSSNSWHLRNPSRIPNNPCKWNYVKHKTYLGGKQACKELLSSPTHRELLAFSLLAELRAAC